MLRLKDRDTRVACPNLGVHLIRFISGHKWPRQLQVPVTASNVGSILFQSTVTSPPISRFL